MLDSQITAGIFLDSQNVAATLHPDTQVVAGQTSVFPDSLIIAGRLQVSYQVIRVLRSKFMDSQIAARLLLDSQIIPEQVSRLGCREASMTAKH